MEDPRAEIAAIIHTLTQAPPCKQKQAIGRYFIPNAAFTHPFCKTLSFDIRDPLAGRAYNSRWAILQIYQWYKLLSPNIKLEVLSTALDDENLLLYVTLRQSFKLWFVFGYEADVFLTTVLKLVKGDMTGPESAIRQVQSPRVGGTVDGNGYMLPNQLHCHTKPQAKRELAASTRYYIAAQNDLYQTSEWIKFLVPFGIGFALVSVWQLFATALSVLGAYLFFWQTWYKENSLGDWPPQKI